MPKIQIILKQVEVMLDLLPEHAAKVTIEDLQEMAFSAVNVGDRGLGVQTVVDGVAQWEDMGPDYAKSDPILADSFVIGAIEEIEVISCHDEFEALLEENPEIGA